MKRKCRTWTITTFLVLLLNVYPQLSKAGGDTPDGDLPTDPDAPIDGGIGLLLAAGVGYGLKKANDQRKKNKMVDMPWKE